ncbi:MBL fold metallo-hydrolase [Rheinheimera sp. UJ51]|uniref:MBL fold metallo-hydrolase n=1 Tax=Rheinheimera sp. UJ51 TaxID=2892446 RepID=UPI001E2F466A|nr:MBL fold metallo-hydrolase [Rheinheimera sp. UJ51]MCC5451710.1 MBL fold metallo-hydrolase [Rheinheimera sp. UJ51]
MKLRTLVTAVSLLVTSQFAFADRFADVQINSATLAKDIYMLTGAGGNMAAVTTADSVLLIDSQYVELADKIRAKLKTLSPGELTTLINTHMHGDHVGGNAALAANADIIAHVNVLTRLRNDSNFNPAGLPKTTFDKVLNIKHGNIELMLEPMPASHTDGDILVWFPQFNIVHMGDLMFQGRFPYIDFGNGGNVQQYIENTRYVLQRIDDNTQVIPGHGDLTNKAGLAKELMMMEQTMAQVVAWRAEGLTEQQMIARGLGEQFNAWHWNFITEARWIKTLYQATQP